VRKRSSIPAWLHRLLGQIQGLHLTKNEDNTLTLTLNRDSRRRTFEVFPIPVLSKEKAAELIKERELFATDPARAPLVATRQLAEQTRELLRKSGISWAEELTGVCHLTGRGLLIDTRIRDDSERKDRSAVQAKLRARSGLVVESILTAFRHEPILIKTIAARAKVSPALAFRVLWRLSRLNLLEVHGSGPNRYWKLSEAGGILDLWAAEEEPPKRVTNLYVWARSPQDLLQKLPELDRLDRNWALGGTAAANLYAPTLSTDPELTVWVDARLPAKEIASALAGEVVDKGSNLRIWQSGDNLPLNLSAKAPKGSVPEAASNVRLVSPARAYIEALTAGGRGPDVAQNLRERILSS
jgi:hypothetical protein